MKISNLKLLVVCGPTASGKTGLAGRLARKFRGEIVSADSRQIYRGLDIATGKEKPRGVKTHLVDIVNPKDSFSVAHFHKIAYNVIENIWQRKKLPILVGGTGLYIKSIIDGIDTIDIPPNKTLRKAYGGKSADELFEIFLHLNPEKADALNPSERKNKQRLIRRIEIEQSTIKGISKREWKNLDTLQIGLTMPYKLLKEKIKERVDKWIKKGARQEAERILKTISKSQQGTVIWYRQWLEYKNNKKTLEQAIEGWKREDLKYAKRQLTWFKKDKRINWFDVSKPEWQKSVDKLVKNWYTTLCAQSKFPTEQ